MQRFASLCLLLAACGSASAAVQVPFSGTLELPLHGHVNFRGTFDLLKAAGLEPVPPHLEPDHIPQATRSEAPASL